MSDKSTALVPVTLEQAKEMAITVADSALLPQALRGRPADVFVTLLAGHEMGLAPMQAIRSMHVINGKPVLSAELMVALCKRRKDVCRYFQLVESTPTSAVYETHREGDPSPTRMGYTLDEANTAGLTSNPTWKKHPAAMLRARASSSLARAVYQDLVLGILEEDEAREMKRELAAGVPDAIDVVSEPVDSTTLAPVAEVRPQGMESGAAVREADFPMASDTAPLMDFDVPHTLMNRIPQLFGDAKKKERQQAYWTCFGHVDAVPARWNPGKVWQSLSQAEREKVLAAVTDLAERMADDLPSDLGWGKTGEPDPDAPGAEKERA